MTKARCFMSHAHVENDLCKRYYDAVGAGHATARTWHRRFDYSRSW